MISIINSLRTLLLGLTAALFVSLADAQDSTTQVQEFVDRAISEYAETGPDAFPIIGDPNGKYHSGELYVFVMSSDTTIIAHAGGTLEPGTNAGELLDSDGSSIGEKIVSAATPEGAWTSYNFINPETGEVGPKRSWVKKHDELIFGAGLYD